MILGNCCNFQEGYVNPTQKEPKYFGDDVKWLRASDLNDSEVYDTERKLSKEGFRSAGKSAILFKKDTLAISKSGTIGILGILKSEMCGNRAVINIEVLDADLYYIFYLLKYKKKEIIGRTSGSIQKNLYVSALQTISLNHEDRKEQSKIAGVLRSLDYKISLNNRINRELESMAKLIYDYWFVQFEFPIEAATAAKMGDPSLKGKPYKSSGGKMVYNEELKREIPEGWEVGNLNDFGEINGGSTPSRAEEENFSNDGTPWITPKDLSINVGKKYITKGEIDVTEIGLKSASLKIMPSGTVLMSSRAPIGYLAIAREKVTTNQGFKSFIPNKGYSSEYIYHTLLRAMPLIEANASGSTFREVSTGVLRELKWSKPTTEFVEGYTMVISPIFKKQDILEQENQKLSELRDWLLPMLMNGQVSIREASKYTEEAFEGDLNMAAEERGEYG